MPRVRPVPGLRLPGGLRLLASAWLLAGACVMGLALPAAASATPTVSLKASFSPEKLGRPTTLRLSVRIAPTGEVVPPPVVEGELLYPAGLSFQLSGLGIDACPAATLELLGVGGCPPNSLMGYGTAVGAIPIKHEAFQESAQIAILRSEELQGHPTLLIYVYVESGVSVQLVLPVRMLPAAKPYGGRLQIRVPLVQAFREGPDISVTELRLVVGPKDLTYYERTHHKTLRYKPAGIPLPQRCPRGGFKFAVKLTFLGGEQAGGKTRVACPKGARS